MYTKCIARKCIPHIDKILYAFCIQNLVAIFLLFLYTKCIAAKVCQNVEYILHTFCIHKLYACCTIFVYKMYTRFLWG